MELRQLEYFVELCKTRNFTRASQNLNVAQPSVTKAIQQLESELGSKLVERSQKPLGLTPAGERFYARVEPLLRELNEAAEEVSCRKSASKQPISIGLSPFSGILLERVLSSPAAMEQGVLFNLVRDSSIEIMSLLKSRKLDLGWVIRYELPDELEFIPMETQEAMLLLPPGHPLEAKEQITFEDLRDAPPTTMLSNQNSILAKLVMERYREIGFEPQLDHSTNQYHPDIRMAVQWVRSGLGPSFVPQHVAEEVTDLVRRSVTPPLTMEVGLAYRKGSRLPAGIQRLIRYLQEEYPNYLHGN